MTDTIVIDVTETVDEMRDDTTRIMINREELGQKVDVATEKIHVTQQITTNNQVIFLIFKKL